MTRRALHRLAAPEGARSVCCPRRAQASLPTTVTQLTGRGLGWATVGSRANSRSNSLPCVPFWMLCVMCIRWLFIKVICVPKAKTARLRVTRFTLTLQVLPRSASSIPDRSAPRARDSRHKVVCARPQAQIVGLSLLHPPIGGRPLAVKSSSSPWPRPRQAPGAIQLTVMACEPEGRREAVICAAGTSWGTLRRLPSSGCVEDADYQGLIVGGLNMRRRLRTPP